jgi:hypothetical protein
MRRTVLCQILGVIMASLFALGLHWTTRLSRMGWSDDPEMRRGLFIFALTIISLVAVGSWMNRLLPLPLNWPRQHGLAETLHRDPSMQSKVTNHPMRDRFLDG